MDCLLTPEEEERVRGIWKVYARNKVELEDCLQEARMAKFLSQDIAQAVINYCRQQQNDACAWAYDLGSYPVPYDGKNSPETERLEIPYDETTEWLAICSKILTPKQYHVVYRRFVDNWTEEDIAEELGISQQRVSQHLEAALKRMRKEKKLVSVLLWPNITFTDLVKNDE